MELFLTIIALISWLTAEAIIVWMILDRNNDFHCPYGCSANTKCNRRGTPDKPNFYDQSDSV